MSAEMLKGHLDAVLLATIGDDDKEKDLDLDLRQCVGRQFVARMEMDDDGKNLNLAYADIYHVDDPAVKEVPKNEAALKLLPPALRRIGQRPAKDDKAKGPTEKKAEPSKPAAEEFDL